MEEIVVNDTNILIDLANSGLLKYCGLLNLDFRTIDFVIEEITDEGQRCLVRNLVDEGVLNVFTLTDEQILKVYKKRYDYQGVCNLSVVDISVMVYASENRCRLITGDKKLREKAISENVTVSGILYLVDMMIHSVDIDNTKVKEALELLLQSNNRLPRRLINERIEMLKTEE